MFSLFYLLSSFCGKKTWVNIDKDFVFWCFGIGIFYLTTINHIPCIVSFYEMLNNSILVCFFVFFFFGAVKFFLVFQHGPAILQQQYHTRKDGNGPGQMRSRVDLRLCETGQGGFKVVRDALKLMFF